MIKSIVITLITLIQSPIGQAATLEETNRRRLVGMRLRTITRQQAAASSNGRPAAAYAHETKTRLVLGQTLDTSGPWSADSTITNRKMADTFKRAAVSANRPMRPDCNVWGQSSTKH